MKRFLRRALSMWPGAAMFAAFGCAVAAHAGLL